MEAARAALRGGVSVVSIYINISLFGSNCQILIFDNPLCLPP